MQEFHRKIRSFVRREGRMTAGQTLAYESMMPDYGFEFNKQLLNFEKLFGNNNPVTLEIGFGMGASLAEQAANYPELNFIGIEVHRPGVGSLLARMKEREVTNIRVISYDAIDVLEHMIEDNSLAKLQLFFPDPWHKTRHHKRRIVKSEFARQVHQKLQDNGVLHMATDWENYAQHMLAVMQQEAGWTNLSATDDYVPKPDDRPVTKFQKRGERLGHGVWDLMFKKDTPHV
ncbi:tRNA (guanosine(46)-N7)-methyltransferase TrmB [Aliikangiella sp. IMCC44359]|uniref:tRNA (guanosine(46)-N7)-methyltransferase TrmB n=1 Tax=Aliikangiella sp. IMCC44359 TaxID=3459125 RepID=UPI00403A89B1